jgi:hypothetical protein
MNLRQPQEKERLFFRPSLIPDLKIGKQGLLSNGVADRIFFCSSLTYVKYVFIYRIYSDKYVVILQINEIHRGNTTIFRGAIDQATNAWHA